MKEVWKSPLSCDLNGYIPSRVNGVSAVIRKAISDI